MLDRLISTVSIGIPYLFAKTRKFRSRESLEQFQNTHVQSHLRFVISHSPYYRSLLQDLPLSEWRSFPITDKSSMMANFDQYNTLGIRKEEAIAVARAGEQTRDFRPKLHGATVGLSSGTSGSFSLFLSSNRENATFIGIALARLLRGSLTSQHRIAFFHRAHSNLYQGLNSGRLQQRFFDLSQDIESQFATLQRFSPTQIIAPPFVLRLLGNAMRRNKILLNPRAILSVAEVLEDCDRIQIEADFQLKIDEAYIATEGFIAATCELGSLHVNEDCLVMQREWLDSESKRFVPIITDFRRRVQPIIRYRLDDVVIESTSSCQCGSPFAVLKKIEGRLDDVLYATDSKQNHLKRVFPDYIRNAISFASDSVRDYRVVQPSVDKLTIRIDTESLQRSDTEQRVRAALYQLYNRLDCLPPQIHFEQWTAANTCKKVRRVIRSYTPPLI
jgi:putative adenylate-forming enzyme